MSVVDVIRHYQRSIEKCSDDGQRMLHCLHKLFRLPVTVQHLKETGIGRTVNALRHHDGEVGDAAKTTVLKWKAMVAAEESSDGEGTGSPSEQVEEVRQNPKQDKEERLKDKSKSSKIKEDRSRSERHKEEKRKDSKHKTESHNHKPEASVDQRKYDKHKVNKDNEKQDHKSEKEKSSKESYSSSSSSRKLKEACKSEDKHSSSSRHSHKRKHKDSSIDQRKDDKKRRKQELERSSDEEENPEDDSDSKEMQVNEHVYDEEYVPCSISRTQEQNEESDSSNSSEAEVYSKENRSRNSSSNYSNGNSYKRHTSEQNHDVPRKHQKHKERSSGEERVHKSESEKTYSSSSSSKTNSYKQKEKGTDSKDHKRSKSDTQKIEVKKEKTELVEKSKLKHEKTKTNDTNSSSKKSKEKEPSKEKSNKKIKLETIDEGISSHSGASFAEALGMVDPIVKKRSSGTNSVSKTPRPSSGKSIGTHDNSDIKTKEPSNKLPKPVSFVIEEPTLLPPPIKLEPLDVDLDATLPEINPNYKPLPHINPDLFSRRSKMSDDEALSRVMSTKNQRTKVYSGVKSNKSWATTPSLFDICVRVLQENIDALEYTGGVPYDLLKPVLNHATPEQLLVLEHYNPYLVEDTDELWEFHCKKRFRAKVREDMETWREMFMRCSDEQEARLKALTTNISQTMKQSTPVRQTKLAYVEGVVKPPRNVAKQQAKYGTARMSSSKASPIKSLKPSASSSTTTSVPPPPRAVPTAKVKHRMAPLMQKTMKLAKSFKR